MSFISFNMSFLIYIPNHLEEVLQEEFPESFQELKDTYNPTPSNEGPTVSLYYYEEDSIQCLKHNVKSDTWSNAYVGHHSYEIEGVMGGSTATSYDDMCEFSIFRKSYPEILSFLSQSAPDMGDAYFRQINPPQCKLNLHFRETEVIYCDRYISGDYRKFNPYSVGLIIRSFLRDVKDLFSIKEDYDTGEFFNPISKFFRKISEYTPFYDYLEYPPFWDNNNHLYSETGNLPFSYKGTPEEIFPQTLPYHFD